MLLENQLCLFAVLLWVIWFSVLRMTLKSSHCLWWFEFHLHVSMDLVLFVLFSICCVSCFWRLCFSSGLENSKPFSSQYFFPPFSLFFSLVLWMLATVLPTSLKLLCFHLFIFLCYNWDNLFTSMFQFIVVFFSCD